MTSSEQLYKQWIVSGAHPADFLLNYPREAKFIDIVDWKWQLRKEATLPIHFTTADTLNRPPTGVAPTLNGVEVAGNVVFQAENVAELVKNWKGVQAKADHSSAEQVRTRVLELLRDNDNLTPAELRALVSALSDIQRIQRTALGLPAEHTGVAVNESKGLSVKFVNAEEDF